MHTYFTSLDLFRQPMYLLSTLLFPSMFFWFFGIPNAQGKESLALLMSSFCCFAILTVVLFQFSVGIAQDKDSTWYYYLRSLPGPRGVLITSRLISGLIFSLLGVAAVIFTAILFSDFEVTDILWGSFLSRLYFGALPFAFLGIALGLAVGSRSILPVANLTYLPMSFAGGLWLPPEILPKVVQNISPYLPTRMYGELMWSSVARTGVETQYVLGLIAYGFGFLVIAVFLHHREQEKSFS